MTAQALQALRVSLAYLAAVDQLDLQMNQHHNTTTPHIQKMY